MAGAGDKVGDGYLEISADTSKVPKQIDDAAKKASEQASKSLPDSVGDGIGRSIGQRLGSTLNDALSVTMKTGLAVAGTAVGVVLGKAISGGMKRLEGLDTAEARLRGLGIIGEELNGVMGQVSKSVDGTVFSLDAAAQAAALMMTSGVQAGDQLDSALSAMVASATAAGAPLEDITAIWQRIAADGKVTNQSIFQLGTRGVNALAALADRFGITQEEAKKMVSEGKVSFDEFNEAMSSALGAMSQAVGESFAGMRANIGSRIGRIGAIIQKPFFDAAKRIMPPILESLSAFAPAVEEAMAPVADKIAPVVDKIVAAFDKLDASKVIGSLQSGISSISGMLLPLAGLAAGALGPLVSQIPILGKLFTGLSGPVGLVIGLIAAMFKESQVLRDAFSSLFSTLGTVVTSLGPVFSVVSELVSLLAKTLGDALGTVISALLPVVTRLVELLGPLLAKVLSGLMPLVTMAADAFGDILSEALNAIVPILLTLAEAVFPILIDVIDTLLPVIMDLATRILPLLMTVFRVLMPVIQMVIPVILMLVEALMPIVQVILDLLVPTLDVLMTAVEWVFGAIQAVVETVVGWFSGTAAPGMADAWGVIGDAATAVAEWYQDNIAPIFEAFAELFEAIGERIGQAITFLWENVFKPHLDAMRKLWEAVWGGIKAVWEKIGPPIMDTIQGYINNLLSIWSSVWNAVKAVFEAVWNAIRTAVEYVLGIIRAHIQTVTSLIRADWSSIWDKVKSLFENAWNGMLNFVKTIMTKVTDTILGIKDSIINIFKNAGTWLLDAGKNIINGLTNGIKKSFTGAIDAVKDGVGKIRNLLPFSPAKEGPLSGRGYTLYSGEKMMSDFAKGITNEESTLADAARRALGTASNVFGDVSLPGSIPLPRTTSSVPTAPVIGAGSTEVTFAPGSITISAKDLEDINTIVDFLSMLQVKARMN